MKDETFHSFAKRKSTDLIYRTNPSNPSLNFFNCLVIMLNVNFGTEPFYIAGALSFGFFFVLVGLGICYVLNLVSYFIYIKCWLYGNTYSFRSIWSYNFNKSLYWIPEIAVFFSFYRLTSLYYDEFYLLLSDIIAFYRADPADIFISREFIIYAVLTGPLFFLIFFVKEASDLLFISYIGVATNIFQTILIFIHFIKKVSGDNFDVMSNITLKWNNSLEIFYFLVHFNNVLSNQPLMEHIVQVMKRPTSGRTNKLYIISSLAGLSVNVIIGIFGALLFGKDGIDKNIVFFFDVDDPLTIILKIACAINIVATSAAMEWMSARHLVLIFDPHSWELETWKPSYWIPHVISCLLVLALNAASSLGTYSLSDFALYSGLIGFIVMQFILIPSYYLKMYPHKKFPWSNSSHATLLA